MQPFSPVYKMHSLNYVLLVASSRHSRLFKSTNNHARLQIESEMKKIRLVSRSLARAQSFTSLMADLYQDINTVSSFSRCLNGTFA